MGLRRNDAKGAAVDASSGLGLQPGLVNDFVVMRAVTCPQSPVRNHLPEGAP